MVALPPTQSYTPKKPHAAAVLNAKKQSIIRCCREKRYTDYYHCGIESMMDRALLQKRNAFINCAIECTDVPIQPKSGMGDCLDTYGWNRRSPFVMHSVDYRSHV